MVEPQGEEGVCAFFGLEGAEPLDSSFDLSVESFDEGVFSYAAVGDVSFFVFSPVPSNYFFDGSVVGFEFVGDDF